MDELIGCCGIDCSACPARKATLENDDALRAQTAAEWSKMYHADIPAEAINCNGCNQEGMHIQHWDECGIRRCGTERGLKTCAGCADYTCEQLDGFHKSVPAARVALGKIRAAR